MIHWFYKKYKLAMILSVVLIVSEINKKSEKFMVNDIMSTPSVYEPRVNSCPSHELYYTSLFYNPNFIYVKKPALLYWTTESREAVFRMEYLVSIFSILYAGMYSDKYGGKNVVLVGLVVCGVIMSVSYLATFRNIYVYLVVIFLRWLSEWIIVAGITSLAGKWCVADDRTMFVSIILVGQSLGEFVGYLVIRSGIYWRTLCYICSFLNFTTALWWWILFRYKSVPKTAKFRHIPWQDMLTYVPIYVSVLIILSTLFIMTITWIQIPAYTHSILHFNISNDWKLVLVLLVSKIFGHLFCGAVSDYIISNRFLSAFDTRRTIYCVLFVFWFCILLVFMSSKCKVEVALACFVVLNFICCSILSTSFTVLLDVSSAFSGIVIGISVTISSPLHYIIFELYVVIFKPMSTIEDWNKQLFIISGLATGLVQPFIVYGVNNTFSRTACFSHSKIRGKRSASRSEELELESNPGHQ